MSDENPNGRFDRTEIVRENFPASESHCKGHGRTTAAKMK